MKYILIITLGTLVFLLLSCSSDVSQLDATIDAQNTRLAQLEDASEEISDDAPTKQSKVPTGAPPTELSPRDITTFGEPEGDPSTTVAASEADPAEVSQLPSEQEKTVPTLLWTAETKSNAYIDNVVFLQTSENTIEAREMSSGSILWSVDNGGEILGAAEDNVYVALTDQRIDAYDSHTGAFKWRLLLESSLFVPYVGISPNSNYIFVNYSASQGTTYTYPVSRKTGQELYVDFPEGPYEIQGDVIIFDNNKAFSATSLELIWNRPEFEEESVLCDGMLIGVLEDESRLEAIDIKNGNTLWTNSVGGDPFCIEGAVNIYTSHWADDGYISTALDRETGKKLWTEMPDFNWWWEIDGLLVYAYSGFGLTQAYDGADHSFIWENPHLVVYFDELSSMRTIIGYLDKETPVGLDSVTGEEIWRYETDVIERMRLISGFLVMILENGDGLEFIDPETGQSLSRIELPSNLFKFGELELVSDKIVISSRRGVAIIKP